MLVFETLKYLGVVVGGILGLVAQGDQSFVGSFLVLLHVGFCFFEWQALFCTFWVQNYGKSCLGQNEAALFFDTCRRAIAGVEKMHAFIGYSSANIIKTYNYLYDDHKGLYTISY